MSKQDIDGQKPSQPAPGDPATLEQQLAKEREARVLMRDRLRHTEALAAESHALRAQMMQELERVTADRDRLKAEAATGTPAAAGPSDKPVGPTPSLIPDIELDPVPAPAAPDPLRAPAPRAARPAPVEPSLSSPKASPAGASTSAGLGDRPLKPPVKSSRGGPWRALAMLGGLAAVVACLAWLTGTMPTGPELAALTGASPSVPPAAAAPGVAATDRPAAPAASTTLAAAPAASADPLPGNAVALPPVVPETQLAANPTAAGPTAAATSAVSASPPVASASATVGAVAQTPAPTALAPATPAGLPDRLRKALDAEGIAAPVDVDGATGHVVVSDPQADRAQRDRTEMLIRAVYAGASLPEPQIEHRWMSPKRGERTQAAQAQAATPAPAPAAVKAEPAPRTGTVSAAAAWAERHPEAAARANMDAVGGRAAPRKGVETTPAALSDAEELRPVVPSGRVTAGCMEDLTGKSTARRANMTACMRRSCCSSAANLNSDECRAYQKAYAYTCGPG